MNLIGGQFSILYIFKIYLFSLLLVIPICPWCFIFIYNTVMKIFAHILFAARGYLYVSLYEGMNSFLANVSIKKGQLIDLHINIFLRKVGFCFPSKKNILSKKIKIILNSPTQR